MTRIDDRGEIIYAFLKANLNQPFRLTDLLSAVSMYDSASTRVAIKRARALAENDDLCFPVACADNGYTYTVTDSPTAVIDPALHLGSIEHGVKIRKEIHEDFIKSRLNKLEPADRKPVKAWLELEDNVRAVQASAQVLMRTMAQMRRENRRDDDRTS